jgi:hypothetical protein
LTTSSRELVERYIQAETDRDWAALQSMRHPDFSETWPQSGEKIVGGENWMVKVVELGTEKVHGETTYFSPESDPPAWRAEWVERVEPTDRDHAPSA